MIIVCDNTDLAEHFHRMISGEELVEVDESEEDDEDDDRPRRKRKLKPQKCYLERASRF